MRQSTLTGESKRRLEAKEAYLAFRTECAQLLEKDAAYRADLRGDIDADSWETVEIMVDTEISRVEQEVAE